MKNHPVTAILVSAPQRSALAALSLAFIQTNCSPPLNNRAAGDHARPRALSVAQTPSPLPSGYDWTLNLSQGHVNRGFTPTVVGESEQKNTQAYYKLCERELGPFPKDTFSCEDAQHMPVTGADNLGASVIRYQALPVELSDIATCDRPSLIYRDLRNIGCASGSRIKRMSTATSDWIYVCRKGHAFFADEHLYSEIGLIGHNRTTGKTCFYAGRPAGEFDVSFTDAEGAEHQDSLAALVGRDLPAPNSQAGVAHWSVPTTPGCTECHSHGPWLNFPFVDGKSQYAEFHWRTDVFGETIPVPVANQGYVEDDGLPVVPARQPGMLYDPVYPHKSLPEFDNPTWHWADVLRLRSNTAGAGMCTTCHQIGNRNYVQRYPHSVFDFGEELSIAWQNPGLVRADLYKGNLTQLLRGSHNTKMLSVAWAQSAAAKIPGFALEKNTGEVVVSIHDDDIHEPNRNIARALDALDRCAQSSECWSPHWTLERVIGDPQHYLTETCSYCHDGSNPTVPRLLTREDFLKGGDAWSRLNNSDNPHPPGGRLQSSLLDALTPYFTNHE